MLRYTVYVTADRLAKESAEQEVTVFLRERGPDRGQGMPMGRFKPTQLEQAATVASFLQDALHNQYVAGLKAGYDNAIAALDKSRSNAE